MPNYCIHLYIRARIAPGPTCREDFLNRAGQCREHQGNAGWPEPGHLEQTPAQTRVNFQGSTGPSLVEYGKSPRL